MPNNINLSTLLILIGATIFTVYLTMMLFDDGDGDRHRVRTQKIDYRVSYFNWQTESGWNFYGPSMTLLTLLCLITWTPASKLRAALAFIVTFALSIYTDISFVLYSAKHLSRSTSYSSISGFLLLALPILTWTAFLWLVITHGEVLYVKGRWAVAEYWRVYNARPRFGV